ncbi:hypothetical protein ACYJW8_00330 [Frateuria aurantia]
MMEQTLIDVEQGIKNLLLVVEQLRGEKVQLSEQLREAREQCEKAELSLMEQEDKYAQGEQRMQALLGLIKSAADSTAAPVAAAPVQPEVQPQDAPMAPNYQYGA